MGQNTISPTQRFLNFMYCQRFLIFLDSALVHAYVCVQHFAEHYVAPHTEAGGIQGTFIASCLNLDLDLYLVLRLDTVSEFKMWLDHQALSSRHKAHKFVMALSGVIVKRCQLCSNKTSRYSTEPFQAKQPLVERKALVQVKTLVI